MSYKLDYKYIAIFLMSIFCVFQFSFISVQAQVPPTPVSSHNMTAADGGETITDLFNVDGAQGTMTLSYANWVDTDSITGAPTGSSGATEPLVYSFGGLTKEPDFPYYFIIDTATMRGFGLVKCNSVTSKCQWLSKKNSEAISFYTSFASTTLTERQKKYLSSFTYGDSFGAYASSYSWIANLSPEKIENTSASINCPEYAVGKVNYTTETLAFNFKNDEDKIRVSKGQPPLNSRIKVWYTPPGSPIPMRYPIVIPTNGTLAYSSTAGATIDNAKQTANLQLSNLKPGKYTITSSFGVEKVKGEDKIVFLDPSLEGSETFASWYTRIDQTVKGMTSGFVAAAKILTIGAVGATYEAYAGSTAVTVTKDAAGNVTTNPALESGCPPSFDYVRDPSKDVNVGGQNTICDSGGTSMVAMIEQGFCGLTVTLKNWADGFFKWAQSWMKASLGIARNDPNASTPASTDPQGLPTFNSITDTQTNNATNSTATNNAGTNIVASTGDVTYSESPINPAKGYNYAAANICARAKTDKVDLTKEPCLIKDLKYSNSTTNQTVDTKAGVQIVKNGLDGMTNNFTKPNKCGATILIVLKTDCTRSENVGVPEGPSGDE